MPSSLDRNNVLRRLEELKRADPHYQVHGSAAHRFELNPPISHGEIAPFESKHRVLLPEDYRHFITAIGNGGAGPFYGLFRFGEHDDGPVPGDKESFIRLPGYQGIDVRAASEDTELLADQIEKRFL